MVYYASPVSEGFFKLLHGTHKVYFLLNQIEYLVQDMHITYKVYAYVFIKSDRAFSKIDCGRILIVI